MRGEDRNGPGARSWSRDGICWKAPWFFEDDRETIDTKYHAVRNMPPVMVSLRSTKVLLATMFCVYRGMPICRQKAGSAAISDVSLRRPRQAVGWRRKDSP